MTFSFGKNWEDFVRTQFDEERVARATQHMLEFLEGTDLKEKTFLDVGCGSGLHSLAALRAGARRVVAFDIDPRSVAAARRIRELSGNPQHWEIREGSILDVGFLRSLEPADIVYAWGSLHHTGQMWTAIVNAARLLTPRGSLYLALYTTTARSPYWLDVKRRYNRATGMGKLWMEWHYIVRHTLLPELLRLRNPLQTIRGRGRSRGMSYRTDVRDWLGGYPFEHARIEEVVRFGRRTLGLELVNIATGEANTEYLLRRAATHEHADPVAASS